MISFLDILERGYRMFARVFPRCSMISQAIAFNLFLAFFPTLLIAGAWPPRASEAKPASSNWCGISRNFFRRAARPSFPSFW